MDLAELFKHENVKMGQGCSISPYCALENVILGDHVVVAEGAQLKNAVVGSHTKISRRVILYSTDPQRPVEIGKYCWLSCDVFGEASGGKIEIGDYAVIAHSTTILTSSGPGTQSPIMSIFYPVELSPVTIGAHSWIGAQCVLVPGCVLIEGVVLGANSLARGTLEAWSVYGGSPAKLIKRLDMQVVETARARLTGIREGGIV